MYTSSPSGEATVSPGVITSDGIEECIIDDDNDDMGKKQNYQEWLKYSHIPIIPIDHIIIILFSKLPLFRCR